MLSPCCASVLRCVVLQDVVSGLSSLASLQELCLGDPFWGDCPITSLSNYQTFMLAQLPQLTSLDTLVLAAETKAAAAATFAKKNLYYNMRRRTLRRGLEDLCRHAKAAQQVSHRATAAWLPRDASILSAAGARVSSTLNMCDSPHVKQRAAVLKQKSGSSSVHVWCWCCRHKQAHCWRPMRACHMQSSACRASCVLVLKAGSSRCVLALSAVIAAVKRHTEHLCC